MKHLKKFNEEVGFDDEEMRDRLEIPNLRGELEPSSPTMKTYAVKSDKVNTETELKKILFRYPILSEFHKHKQMIEGSLLMSFYATSKVEINDEEYYAQISFAYHNNQYYIGTILRDRLEENEENWVKHTFFFEDVQDIFKIVEAFLDVCQKLGVIEKQDLEPYKSLFN